MRQRPEGTAVTLCLSGAVLVVGSFLSFCRRIFGLLLLHCGAGSWQHDLFRAGGVTLRRLVVCFSSHAC